MAEGNFFALAGAVLAALALAAGALPTPVGAPTCVIQPSGALVVTPGAVTTGKCVELYKANWVWLAQAAANANGVGTFAVADYIGAGGSGAVYNVEVYAKADCTGALLTNFACTATLAPGATQPPTPVPKTPRPSTAVPSTAVPTTAVPSTCAVTTAGGLQVVPGWTTSKCIDLYDANWVFLAQVVASAGGTGVFNAASYIAAGNQYWVEGYNTTNCKGKVLSYFECTASAPNFCASSPCLNGGSCVNGASGYTCTCAPGYTGTTCASVINNCASSPCANGGTCTNIIGAGTFTCACTPGYTGATCGAVIDNCASSPCANGGTCTNIIGAGSFTCACAPGYTGATCGAVINNCASSPCANGGTCTNIIGAGTFTCA